MEFHPYSIDNAPRTFPIWKLILEDLGHPPPRRIAKVLGVGLSTVYRWNQTGCAPRAACLALFWLTSWGRASVHADAVNDCQVAVGYANALESQLHEMRRQLEHALALNSSGAANDAIEAPGERPRQINRQTRAQLPLTPYEAASAPGDRAAP